MEPQNVLLSDITSGIDLPQAQPDEEGLSLEKSMALFSKTTEFKRIQEHCQGRIEFYQQYLPNGAEVGLDVVPTTEDWRVANRVIGEMKLLMGMYEVAAQAVEESVNGLQTTGQ